MFFEKRIEVFLVGHIHQENFRNPDQVISHFIACNTKAALQHISQHLLGSLCDGCFDFGEVDPIGLLRTIEKIILQMLSLHDLFFGIWELMWSD